MTTTDERRDAAYMAALNLDVLLAKALKVNEVALIAAAEERLRTFCMDRWFALATDAVLKAEALTLGGSGKEPIVHAVDDIMRAWAPSVAPPFMVEVENVYILARKAGGDKAIGFTTESLVYDTPPVEEPVKKAKGDVEFKVAFDVVDQHAVEAIQGNNLFWVGNHYDKNVSAAVAEVAEETLIKAGSSRATAAAAMATAMTKALGSVHVPGGYHGSASSYLEGLVANAMTTARVQGQVRSFEVVGITSYELVSPSDERTCPTCAHMAGKQFTVESARKQIELEQAINSPDMMSEAHPWLSTKEMLALSPIAGHVGAADSAALAKAGFGLPPFHFRCRCTVDVTDTSQSFNDLG